MHVLLHVYARSVCPCMFMYVTFAVNAMRIFGNNRKIIGNNWTISQELWNRIIGKILSIIASGLLPSVETLCIPPKKLPILLLIPKNFTHYSLKFSNYSQYFTYYSQILIPETQHVMQKYYWGEPERAPH